MLKGLLFAGLFFAIHDSRFFRGAPFLTGPGQNPKENRVMHIGRALQKLHELTG
jgi:hypothetical protein